MNILMTKHIDLVQRTFGLVTCNCNMYNTAETVQLYRLYRGVLTNKGYRSIKFKLEVGDGETWETCGYS